MLSQTKVELPTFDAIDEANELIGALVMSLWNRLTRHQDRSSPFRLLRMEAGPTRTSLAALAQVRRRENSTASSRGLSGIKK